MSELLRQKHCVNFPASRSEGSRGWEGSGDSVLSETESPLPSPASGSPCGVGSVFSETDSLFQAQPLVHLVGL